MKTVIFNLSCQSEDRSNGGNPEHHKASATRYSYVSGDKQGKRFWRITADSNHPSYNQRGRSVNVDIEADDLLDMLVSCHDNRRALIDHLIELERDEHDRALNAEAGLEIHAENLQKQLDEANKKLTKHAKFRAIGGAL